MGSGNSQGQVIIRPVPDTLNVTCPHCGETNTISVTSEEDGEEFVQDCAVCCRPWQVRVTIRRDGSPEISVRAEGE